MKQVKTNKKATKPQSHQATMKPDFCPFSSPLPHTAGTEFQDDNRASTSEHVLYLPALPANLAGHVCLFSASKWGALPLSL